MRHFPNTTRHDGHTKATRNDRRVLTNLLKKTTNLGGSAPKPLSECGSKSPIPYADYVARRTIVRRYLTIFPHSPVQM